VKPVRTVKRGRSPEAPQGRHANAGDGTATLQEIAEALGLTKQRVQQVEARALRKALAVLQARGLSARDLLD